MKKEIIELLIKLVNNRLNDVIEYKRVFLNSSEQVEIDNHITFLKECIDELNKLSKI